MSQDLSNLFESLSRELTQEMLDEVSFLIDDYLEVFGISDNVLGRQMFDELHRHLGTRQLLQLLSEVFKVIDRRDLGMWISSYASQLTAEDAVRLEESPNRSPVDADASVDSALCQLPSVQTDADSTETIAKSAGDSETVSTDDFSGSSFQLGEFLDSLDNSENRTVDSDEISPLNTLMESPQHSNSSSADSGFSSGSASTTSPSSVASLNLLRTRSSSTSVELEHDTAIELKIEEMKCYIDYNSKIGKGGFGTVYKGEYKQKPVAIKTGRLVEDSERQFLKEKQLAFLRNTFIVPILAYTIEKDEMLMIMYPYMDNSDLTKVCQDLNWRDRLRVFYQCSEGLAFLHRPVPGVRNEIIHGDIKPGNILLDANFNARLGDVGVAAELPKDATHYTTTHNIVYGTEGYEDPFSRPETNAKVVRRKENDVFSLGVVGLQFLKWQPAVLFETDDEEGLSEKLLLRAKLFKEIKPRNARKLLASDQFFDKAIWHQDQQDIKTNEEVAELVLACLESPPKRVTSEGLACKLKELLVANNIPRYKIVGNSCQYCCIKLADLNPTLIPCSDTCQETCEFKRLCQSCHQTAYRNPLYCPEHGRLKQFIRPEECFAILISGFDDEEEDQKVFDDDVQNMFNIITDPRVMGFSKNNVFRMSTDTVEKHQEIINLLQMLKEKPVEMLIVYYSGHGTEETEGDPQLEISKDDTDNMKDQELKELLNLVQCTRLLVILDCCFAARYKVVVEKPGGPVGWRIQLNGTGADKEGNLTENSFTRHLICAVNGFHICPGTDDENAPPCRMCVKFKKLSETRGYIDVYDFIGFCSEHIKLNETNDKDCPDSNMSAGGTLCGKAELALFNSKPFVYIFQYQNKDDEREKFHLWNLKQNPDDILRELWNKINACSSLPKHTDYRCLKMQGLVRAKEEEIRTRDELDQQFIRGYIVQVCIRSKGSDLDREKNVVVFCSQHDKFIEMLNCLAKNYASCFQKEEPLKDIEAEYSCIIKCGETDDITNNIASIWNYSSYDEKKNFSNVLSDSLSRANTISREQLNAGHPSISGLRIDVTKEFALLAIV